MEVRLVVDHRARAARISARPPNKTKAVAHRSGNEYIGESIMRLFVGLYKWITNSSREERVSFVTKKGWITLQPQMSRAVVVEPFPAQR